MTDNTSQQPLGAEPQPAAMAVPAEESPVDVGFGAQLFGKVAKVKEQAQSSLSSLADMTDELKNQAAAKVEEVRDAGLAKLMDTLDDFNSALPILREAGYALTGITLSMGIPPSLVGEFCPSQEVSSENIERLLTEHAEKRLTVLLIKALHNAWVMQTKLSIGGLTPTGVSVEVGLIPVVSLSFT